MINKKNIAYTVIMFCSILSAISVVGNDFLEVTGKIKDLLEGEKIVMLQADGISGFHQIPIDSSEVKNGVFHFKTKLTDGPRMINFVFGNHPVSFLVVVLGNEKVEINGQGYEKLPHGNIREHVSIDGSQYATEFSELEGLFGLCYQYNSATSEYIDKLGKTDEMPLTCMDGFMHEKEIFNNALGSILMWVLETKPHNQTIPFFLMNFYPWIGKEKFLPFLYEKLDDNAKASYYGKLLNQIIPSTIGKDAPRFEIKDSKGESVNLEDIIKKNKVTLLYFWSESSGRPRQEMLYGLTTKYNQYHNKGLEIIGISVDNNIDKWKKGLKVDQTPWYQINDFKGDNDGIAKSYGYSGNISPFNFLIDKNGKIIAWQIEGIELQWHLSNAFDK